MTTVRSPLVLVSGKIEELPSGDVILGAPAGATGATGSTGTAGVAATISVGTVTTGAAGSSASVTNSGTSSAAVFDFTIPRGDTGAATGFTKIAQVVTTSSQSTITFSSIPNSYTDLMLVITGQDTATGSASLNVRMKINSDGTSSNYTQEQFHENVNTTNNAGNNAASANGSVCCRIPGSQNNANAVGSATITIPNYKGTTFYKTVIGVYGQFFSNNAVPLDAGNDFFVWKNTAAITDIVLTAGGTAFVDGTTATLYGLG